MNKTSKIFVGFFLVFSLVCTSFSAFAIESTSEGELENNVFTESAKIDDTTVYTLSSQDEFTEISELTTILKNANVNDNDIAVLIEKYKNNELWDSCKEEYRDLEPQIVRDGYSKTIYPDGSFIELTVKNRLIVK